MLNRQVRNATPGIEPVRSQDGLRRAHRDTGIASSAVGRQRLTVGQRQVDINLAQKKHGAGFTVEQQRVFAAPALTAAFGQLDLQHRS